MFDPLDHPICLEVPERLTDVTSWHPHIPFAFVIVDLVRPAVLVELGVHKGDSYCAFCQAVAALDLDTRCYGIDTWQGDAHAGPLGESILLDLKAHHDHRYGHFSTLLRCSFDQALDSFRDGSVDLLHIDGYHTFEAVKHDFETWLPKMSPNGVVLLHDTHVRDADFGVWRLFDELKERYPAFAFEHGHGLGVVAVGEHVPPGLEAFFAGDDAVAIARFFSLIGDRVALIRDQARQIAEAEAELSGVRALLRHQEERLRQETKQVAWLERQLAESRVAHARSDDLLQQKVNEARQLALRLEQLDAKFADVQEAYRQAAFDLEALRGTYSVRLSRAVGDQIKRLRRGVSRFRRRHTPIDGSIDRPHENSRVSRTATVEGWAFSTVADIASVEVLLQHTGTVLGTATYALERLDVRNAHPGLTHPYCGFRGTVSLTSVPAGRQVLVVRVTDAAGNRRDFVRTVQVAEPVEAAPRSSTGPSITESVGVAPATRPDTTAAALEAFARARLRTLLDKGERLKFPEFANPLVTIVVPTFNQAHYTYLAFESLLSAGWEIPFELVVVDNGSTDETRGLLQRLDNVRVHLNHANLGFGNACDVGAALARGEYVCFLNSDAFVTPGWLKSLVRTVETYPRCGAVGAKLVYPGGQLQEAGSIIWDDGSASGYGRGRNPHDPEFCYVREVDFCSAACLLIRRQLFINVGGFDDRYTPAYYEDADVCMAVREAGYVVVYQPDATVFHVENGSGDASKAVTLQVRNQAKFVAKWQDRLRDHHSAASLAMSSARDRRSGRRVLVVDDRVPDPALGSGFPRARALLHSLADLGFVVTLLAREPSADSHVATELRQRGIEVIHGVVDLEEKLVERGDQYDVAIVSRPHNAMCIDILRRSSPRTAIVYDAEAIYALREIRQAQILGGALPDSVADARVRSELAPLTSADVVVAVSEVERRLFECYHSGTPVAVWGHPIVAVPGANDFHARADLLFVGYLATPPNADAVLRLLTEIFPKLANEIDCQLIVVGSSPPDAVTAAASTFGDRVVFTGYVDDLSSIYDQSRVFVAPHRFSAGIPLKVIESMAHGVPCVVSRHLAEQLQVEDGAEVLVADDEQQFVEQIVRLYRDPAVWQRVRQQALHHVDVRYNPTTMKDALARWIDEALARKNGKANEPSPVPVDERVR